MLQVHETVRVAPIRRQPPAILPAKRKAAKPSSSRLDEKIKDLYSAHRAVLFAKQKLAKLKAQYPDLAKGCKPVLAFTDGEGKKVFCSTKYELGQLFPKSFDVWSPKQAQRRNELEKQINENHKEWRDRCIAVGLKSAERLEHKAFMHRKRCLKELCRYRPASLLEARKQVRAVRALLPKIVDDYDGQHHNIYGSPSSNGQFKGWGQARNDAFDYLASLTLAISTAGGR